MASMEKVIKGLKKCSMEGVDCKHCPYDGAGTKERSCENLMERDALKVIREKNQRIWELQEKVEYFTDKMKEQEADIIAMSRFLESHGWDSDSICGKNVEIIVTNGDDNDA